MNFSAQEFMYGRQRIRQWVPLITQQSRLRHVYQIMGLNIGGDTDNYYFTLHLTTMCAPFYTSETVSSPNPKWAEFNLINMPNLSASCIVLRVWQHSDSGADKIILTWGVNFSGLCYIGNKISDIQPFFFKKNSVIFSMQGGFYTSHQVIRTDLQKPVPFFNNVNLIETTKNNIMYKRIAIKSSKQEAQSSYTIEKLRKLHHLQVQIRKREADVQNIRDKINVLNGFNVGRDNDLGNSSQSTSFSDVRYAPQLLTMNCLNKMLQEKPTHFQKQEMLKMNKQIEISKFKTKLLSQEKAKKTVIIRNLKEKHAAVVERNEERNSDLMENYHKLSRGSEKLKDYKRNLLQHREMYANIYSQLQQRRRQLLKELLFIFPIEKISEEKYSIIGIYLPNSDVLADCNDVGLSVALGCITHILIMCSTFLQVPIRYPLTHYGSRSFITDNVSPLLPDKERDFPLFTRGKEKAQFTYAVYLLNKNLAQFRWLIYMNTTELRATLYNLLTFLQGPRDLRLDPSPPPPKNEVPLDRKLEIDKLVNLRSFSSISNVSDPLLDCIRHETRLERSNSPSRDRVGRGGGKKCSHGECGRGLSEILAVPEAYMNRQISSDSFRNFVYGASRGKGPQSVGECCGSSTASELGSSLTNFIKITNGKEVEKLSYFKKQISIEQGTDPLAATSTSLPLKISSEVNLREKKDHLAKYGANRISRSVGSYSDDETGLVLRANFELGSEPLLNNSSEDQDVAKSKEGQQKFLEKWLENAPNFAFSSEEMLSGSPKNVASERSPLMARTNALHTNTTFNLVRPK